MALNEALQEFLVRVRAAGSPVVDALAMPGLPADEVRARLDEWCGHATDELVTWFSTINGIKPGAPMTPGHRHLVGTFQPVTLDRAIQWSQNRSPTRIGPARCRSGRRHTSTS